MGARWFSRATPLLAAMVAISLLAVVVLCNEDQQKTESNKMDLNTLCGQTAMTVTLTAGGARAFEGAAYAQGDPQRCTLSTTSPNVFAYFDTGPCAPHQRTDGGGQTTFSLRVTIRSRRDIVQAGDFQHVITCPYTNGPREGPQQSKDDLARAMKPLWMVLRMAQNSVQTALRVVGVTLAVHLLVILVFNSARTSRWTLQVLAAHVFPPRHWFAGWFGDACLACVSLTGVVLFGETMVLALNFLTDLGLLH